MLSTEDSDELELVSVEDDALAEVVFEKYMELVDDEDDGGEDSEGDDE